MARPLLSFPHPVDEISARTVAAGVVVLGAAFVVTGWSLVPESVCEGCADISGRLAPHPR